MKRFLGAPIHWKQLLTAVFLTESVGIIGSFFTYPAIPTWYATLTKPAFSPPNFVFGPVWTILYALMGISLYLVWTAEAKSKRFALTVFFLQLGLNLLWSILFFGLRDPGLAFFEIIVLWVAIIYTIKAFRPISKTASYLLYPYLSWVTFAAVLNYAIWMINK